MCVCACVPLSIVIAASLTRFGRTMGRMTMKSTQSTGPSTRPLACSLAPHTHSLSPHYSLRSRAPLRSLVSSLAHPLARELIGKRFLSKNFMRRFHAVSTHCGPRVCVRVSPLHFVSDGRTETLV